MMKTLLSIIKSILSVLLSIFVINRFNVFSLITFIPDEFSFEIYLTLYIAVFELGLTRFLEKIEKKYYGEINCVFYESNDKISKDSNPTISFNEEVCYIKCSIHIRGSVDLFKDNKLIISLPNWVSVQSIDKSSILKSDGENRYVVLLSEILPVNQVFIENSKADIKLGFILEDRQDNYEITLTPELFKNRFIKFEFNKINLCS